MINRGANGEVEHDAERTRSLQLRSPVGARRHTASHRDDAIGDNRGDIRCQIRFRMVLTVKEEECNAHQ